MTSDIEFLAKSGLHQHQKFSVYYNYGDQFLYYIGGEMLPLHHRKNMNFAMKFDVFNLKWYKMPDMLE